MSIDLIQTTCELVGTLNEWAEAKKALAYAATQKAVTAQAQIVLQTAQSLVPVETGTLKSSLETTLEGTYATVRCNAKVAPYSYLVHFGTVNMAANPFLYQASDMHRAGLLPLIEENFETSVDDD